ncbi:GGDEF domain-containing protein [Candidatus Gracilibacteria bacterium]|nr:GGDEF domain-containing protein [Candidatus Gracilibacteria bacterium]
MEEELKREKDELEIGVTRETFHAKASHLIEEFKIKLRRMVSDAITMQEGEFTYLLKKQYEITKLANRDLSLRKVFQEALDIILNIERAGKLDKGCIFEVSETADQLHLLVDKNFSEKQQGSCDEFGVNQCICENFLENDLEVQFISKLDNYYETNSSDLREMTSPHGNFLIKVRKEPGNPDSKLLYIVNLYMEADQDDEDDEKDENKQQKSFALIIANALSALHRGYRLHQEFLREVNYDRLTGLPNRRFFKAQLKDEIRHFEDKTESEKENITIIVLKVEGLKEINYNPDKGRKCGDEFIIKISNNLQKEFLKRDITIARDRNKFFLLGKFEQEKMLIFMDIIEKVFDVDLDFSCGVSFYPQNEGDPLQNAENAIDFSYGTHARFHFFKEEENQAIFQRQKLENELREAIESPEGGGLMLFYQPKVNPYTGEIKSFESLVRWDHPKEGRLSPGKFLPLAEETGLIVPLGEWVLKKACQDAKSWQSAYPGVGVSVNVDSQQLENIRFPELVENILKETNLDETILELEITESGVLPSDKGAVKKLLQCLRDLGIHLGMDDFGTGYASPKRLIQMTSFDTGKIDQVFIRGKEFNEEEGFTNFIILKSLIDLVRAKVHTVVTEGVEEESELDAVTKAGTDLVQGFYYSRPVPLDKALNLLQESKKNPIGWYNK